MKWEELRNRGSSNARSLRKQETSAEDVLWAALRGRKLAGLNFRRQHPVRGVILDFYCAEHWLGIEVDGSVHDQQIEWDADRTRYLNELGYCIIRFRNDEVMNSLDLVLQRILQTIHER